MQCTTKDELANANYGEKLGLARAKCELRLDVDAFKEGRQRK